jgi:hypothetical protein
MRPAHSAGRCRYVAVLFPRLALRRLDYLAHLLLNFAAASLRSMTSASKGKPK